jgi:hypothetical protein
VNEERADKLAWGVLYFLLATAATLIGLILAFLVDAVF